MKGPAKRYWQNLTWPEFAALDTERSIAILPLAAIEQHGPHLPVCTDRCINQGLLDLALKSAPENLSLLALPIQAVGKSVEHLAYPGTLTLSAETLARVCMEIGASVHRAGIRRLVLMNSHGGQPQILDIVARDLRIAHGLFVVTAGWSRLGCPEGMFSEAELTHGIHGGDVETSLMLHLRPDLVQMDQARNFVPRTVQMEQEYEYLTAEGRIGFGWQIQDLHAAGACGDASRATAEKGRLLAEFQVSRFIALLHEVARYPLDAIRADIFVPEK